MTWRSDLLNNVAACAIDVARHIYQPAVGGQCMRTQACAPLEVFALADCCDNLCIWNGCESLVNVASHTQSCTWWIHNTNDVSISFVAKADVLVMWHSVLCFSNKILGFGNS